MTLVMVCGGEGGELCAYHADGGPSSERCPGYCANPECSELADDMGELCAVDETVEALKAAFLAGQIPAVMARFEAWIAAYGKGSHDRPLQTRAEPPF